MDWSHILTFVVMAIVIEVSPGPNFVLISKTVTSVGRASAMANISGFATAFLLHGTLSIFGVSIILMESPAMFTALKLMGAAYLFYLGAQAVAKSVPSIANPSTLPVAASAVGTVDIELTHWDDLDHQIPKRLIPVGFRDGFVTNCLNPKISLFYLAVFPQFIVAGADRGADSFLLVMIHVVVNALWFFLVALLIERLICHKRHGRAAPLLTLVSGIALIGFAASFVASALGTLP